MLEMFALGFDKCNKMISTLINCFINDKLLYSSPCFNHMLHQFIHVPHWFLINMFLHDFPLSGSRPRGNGTKFQSKQPLVEEVDNSVAILLQIHLEIYISKIIKI